MTFQRWYDRDPALSRAIQSLRQASDRHQAQIALNILKITVEHQIEDETGCRAGDIRGIIENSSQVEPQRRRWYDVDETLRAAMQLLHDCPDDLQQTVIPAVCRMIETTLSQLEASNADAEHDHGHD
ncbi:MAG: hypothetical protein VKJ06_07815 [Vampirovibrionales bacterium]|nr:hypothetical protein [Vampirovibrionales bacterium]